MKAYEAILIYLYNYYYIICLVWPQEIVFLPYLYKL